jgi:oligopeptidase B
VGRIQEDDQDVPIYHEPFWYYKRTVQNKNYPIYARKATLDSPEEVLLDLNLRSEEYIDLGDIEVSPDHSILAFSLDFNGNEKYQLFFKNLETNQILEKETIENTSGSIAW